MDLVRWLTLCFLLSVSAHVFADGAASAPDSSASQPVGSGGSGSPSGGSYWVPNWPANNTLRFSSAQDACASMLPNQYPGSKVDHITFQSDAQSLCWFSDGVHPLSGDTVFKFSVTCPSGQSFDSTTLKCVSSCPKAGTSEGGEGTVIPVQGTQATLTICVQGCVLKGSLGGGGAPNGAWLWGPYSWTGDSCSTGDGSGVPSGSKEPTGSNGSCGAGKCPGTVNGTQVCVACSNTSSGSSSSSSSSSSTTPSGSASGASSPTGSTPSSSSSGTSSQSTTSCSGGSCTTTTTTTSQNPDGSSTTSTGTKTQDQGSFCSENPTSTICKANDSSWGGSCAGGFSCDGDAVQCAQAQAAWKSACAFDIDPSDPNKALGQQVVSGTLPDSDPRKNGGDGDVDVSSQIDQSNPYVDACPGDLEVPIGNYGSIMVPFSRACPYFQFAGYIAVACALAVAAKIALGTT